MGYSTTPRAEYYYSTAIATARATTRYNKRYARLFGSSGFYNNLCNNAYDKPKRYANKAAASNAKTWIVSAYTIWLGNNKRRKFYTATPIKPDIINNAAYNVGRSVSGTLTALYLLL